MWIPSRVISGGQTGADQGGLLGAKALGIPTGGWAPKGYLTEKGPQPWLHGQYGLRETRTAQYRARTMANVMEADATVVWGKLTSVGSRLTIIACQRSGKPYLTNPTVQQLREWVGAHKPDILNISGNRESINPGIETYVAWLLQCAWGTVPSYSPPTVVLKG